MLLNKTKKLYAVLFLSAFSFTVYAAEHEGSLVSDILRRVATSQLFGYMLALPNSMKPTDLEDANGEQPVEVMIGRNKISFPVKNFKPDGYPQEITSHPDFKLLTAAIGPKDEKLARVMQAIEGGADSRLTLSMKFLEIKPPLLDLSTWTPVYSYLEKSQSCQLFEIVLTSSQPLPLDFTLAPKDPSSHLWVVPRTPEMLKVLVAVSQSKSFELPKERIKSTLLQLTDSTSHSDDIFEAFLKLPGWLNPENKKLLFWYVVSNLHFALHHQESLAQKIEFLSSRLQRIMKHVDSSDLSDCRDSLTKAKDCLTRVRHELTQREL